MIQHIDERHRQQYRKRDRGAVRKQEYSHADKHHCHLTDIVNEEVLQYRRVAADTTHKVSDLSSADIAYAQLHNTAEYQIAEVDRHPVAGTCEQNAAHHRNYAREHAYAEHHCYRYEKTADRRHIVGIYIIVGKHARKYRRNNVKSRRDKVKKHRYVYYKVTRARLSPQPPKVFALFGAAGAHRRALLIRHSAFRADLSRTLLVRIIVNAAICPYTEPKSSPGIQLGIAHVSTTEQVLTGRILIFETYAAYVIAAGKYRTALYVDTRRITDRAAVLRGTAAGCRFAVGSCFVINFRFIAGLCSASDIRDQEQLSSLTVSDEKDRSVAALGSAKVKAYRTGSTADLLGKLGQRRCRARFYFRAELHSRSPFLLSLIPICREYGIAWH